MTVDDVVEAIYRRLCDHQQAQGVGAAMSLGELRLALGVSDGQLMEAIKVARLSDDRFVAFPGRARDRVTLGTSWRQRCEDEAARGAAWATADAPPVDPHKVSLIADSLRQSFPGHAVHTEYNIDRSAQFFRLEFAGAIAHRVFVSKEFLDDNQARDLAVLLDEWELAARIRSAGIREVLVSNRGVTIPAMREDIP